MYAVLYVAHLVSLIIRVNSNSCVSEHGLDTSGGHDHLFLCPLNGVGKWDKNTKLYLLVIAWHTEKSATG